MNKLLCFIVLIIFSPVAAFSQQICVVSTFAGTNTMGNDTINTAGFTNGADSVAKFNSPAGIAADTAGNVYVADTYNNVIRRINNRTVTTLAGNGIQGYNDGQATAAEFNQPLGVCVDKHGNIYVADTYNNVIREISIAGNVVTFAGNGAQGYTGDNGPATAAELNLPVGVAADTLGNIYVTDNGNQVIREISTSGTITTFAGNHSIGYRNGASSTAEFEGLYGIATDDSGSVYVTEYINDDVRKIRNGIVTTLAGYDTNVVFHNPSVLYDPFGYRNGTNDTALFYDPTGIAVDSAGNVYLSDEYNHVIRKIGKKSVSTFAGDSAAVISGYVNGAAISTARFNSPLGIALDRKGMNGHFYVADNGNNVIRKIAFENVTGEVQLVSKPISELSVFPNPCSGRLNIVKAPKGKASLFDVTGREVWSREDLKTPCTINTSDILPGLYILSIQSAAGVATQKIIVQY